MNNIITIKNINFSYPDKKEIFSNLSTTIEKGKITTILGKNGCGKSTLLHLLATNLHYKEGSILFKNKELKNYSKKELAKNISVVYQKNDIPEEITVFDLVSFGRLPYQNIMFPKFSKKDLEMIEFALVNTDLIDQKYKLVNELSGGQIQRVFIAMCIAQGTDTIILDEPTTFLDISYQKNIMALIKRLNTEFNYTIIMVLHDINQALLYSDNIIALKNGKIITNAPAKNFYDINLLSEIYETDIELNNGIVVSW